MLPDEILKDVADRVAEHFEHNDERLTKAAHKLADAGWSVEEILPLLNLVLSAGYDEGFKDGVDH